MREPPTAPSTFIRNIEAWAYLEIFLVSAVAAVLGIRAFLELTGYPKLGGGRLHIAHMLWGGLLMLIAIVILLSFLGKASQRIAALVGGFGFGTFIDEVGKFVTADNDYFFRPAVALIYVTFVATYLFIHTIRSGRAYSSQEYLVNAIREMEEVALHDLDEEDQRRALLYLERSDPAHPLVVPLREILSSAALAPLARPGPFSRAKAHLQRLYRRAVAMPVFPTVITAFFIGKLLLAFSYVFGLIFLAGVRWDRLPTAALAGHIAARVEHLTPVDVAHLLSSVAAGAFIAAGVVKLRSARRRAFEMFENSVLVSIFVTQVFSFYKEQFGALLGLAWNIFVLMAVRFIIEQERLSITAAGDRKPLLKPRVL
jgi:hypothetical protein